MKRSIGISLAVLLGIAFLLPSALAVEDEPEAAEVTQLQLAEILVNMLGLTRNLPADPTAQEKFAALMTNGVVPQEGWVATSVVTKATLARLVVQAMGRADEIENPDDPSAWIDFLVANDIPIDTVGQAADNLEPLAEPVVDNVVKRSTSSDPMVRQDVFGLPDERTFGTDVSMVLPPIAVVVPQEVVEAVIAAAAVRRPKPSPVTPDGS